MGEVRKSIYRQPVTKKGLELIETNKLQWFDGEMFANFNTGVMEQYYDEKNRGPEGFYSSKWGLKILLLPVIIGIVFAAVNQYVGLKVGMVVSGSYYLIFLIGMALKWKPGEVNIASTAGNGAAMICTGFVFTYPAIYLLAMSPQYELAGGGHLVTNIPSIGIAIAATMLSGILGIMYFIIFRRIWLVDDPLPMPGFEANVKILEIAYHVSAGEESDQSKRSIRLVSFWTGITALFTFFRDFPFSGKPIFDHLMGGKYYGDGNFVYYLDIGNYHTKIGFGLIPIQAGIGWFMKARTAILISLGTLFTWFVVVPMAIIYAVPVFVPSISTAGNIVTVVDSYWATVGMTSVDATYINIAKTIAIGAILGGGITSLLKMAPVFKSAITDVTRVDDDSNARPSYIKGQGWYEWPASHIGPVATITFFSITLIFIGAGFPVAASIIFSFLLVSLTFLLGAIAVKIMGETGTEPVSATSFIVLLMLMAVFRLMGVSMSQTVIMAFIGTTVFGGAISMSGDLVNNFKVGLYAGNRPYHLLKALTIGVIPGTIVSGLFVEYLSKGLATGVLNLVAPQANAFAKFAQMLAGGNMDPTYLIVGFIIGILMEFLTGMGTAFGLGMYFPLSITTPMLAGGILRDVWEEKYLLPKVKKENWNEDRKTLKLLDTYMAATGLIIGEAIMGTIVAIYLVLTLV